MALNDVKFIKQDGSIGGVLPNEDHISAIVFLYTYADGDTPPTITYENQEVTSLKDAETKGITSATYPLEHYHISEFFRINSNARLFIGYELAQEAMYTFSILNELQNIAQGKIRQFGVVDRAEFSVNRLTTLHNALIALDNIHKPAIAVYGADMGGDDLLLLPDLRTRTDYKVSVLITQSATGVAPDIQNSLGISIPSIGNLLGIISKSAVHENIGWIEKFRIDGNDELVEIDFCTGDKYTDVPQSTLTALNDKGYIFARHHIGIAGTYYNDSHTATAITGDYSYLERNRTIEKAIRGMRKYLLPKLNSPLELDASTGQLALPVVKNLENLAAKALEQMQKDGELSGFKVTINPNQDVLTTSELQVTVQLVIKGVARTITVSVAFAKSVN